MHVSILHTFLLFPWCSVSYYLISTAHCHQIGRYLTITHRHLTKPVCTGHHQPDQLGARQLLKEAACILWVC